MLIKNKIVVYILNNVKTRLKIFVLQSFTIVKCVNIILSVVYCKLHKLYIFCIVHGKSYYIIYIQFMTS